MRTRFAALALIALAGCDAGTEPSAPVRPIKVTGDQDYQAQLKALSPTNRDLALRRAIQDTGNQCKRIDGAVQAGTFKVFETWTVRCSDSGDWMVFVAATGDVQVRACRETAELQLPACATDRIAEAAR